MKDDDFHPERPFLRASKGHDTDERDELALPLPSIAIIWGVGYELLV